MKMIDNRNWIWIVAGIEQQLELDSNWHWVVTGIRYYLEFGSNWNGQ